MQRETKNAVGVGTGVGVGVVSYDTLFSKQFVADRKQVSVQLNRNNRGQYVTIQKKWNSIEERMIFPLSAVASLQSIFSEILSMQETSNDASTKTATT
jgi:hypothetical protein